MFWFQWPQFGDLTQVSSWEWIIFLCSLSTKINILKKKKCIQRHILSPTIHSFTTKKTVEAVRKAGTCTCIWNHRFDYQIQSDLRYPNKHTTITRGRGQGHTTLAPTLKKKPCKSTCDLQVTRTHHTQNIYNGVPGVSSATCRVQKTMH